MSDSVWPHRWQPTRLCRPWDFPGKNIGVGCHCLLQKKSEYWEIDAFELRCWRRLLIVPWTARRSNQSILKEISPGISLEGMMLKLKVQYFGYLMRRVDSLEKEMATHSSVLAWRIPGTAEPGGLLSMGSHRVRHDWSDLAAAAAWNTLLPCITFFKTLLGLAHNYII